MNVICKLTAWTNKTAALGIVAVALAAFGTVVGPAPKVADIGTAWCVAAEKARSLDKANALGKQNEFDKRDSLAAKIDENYMDKINSLGVDQF